MSVKIAFFTRYGRQGASSRYRFIQFFDIYRREGLEPVHLPFYSNKYLQRKYAGKATVFHLISAFIRRFTQILVARKRYPLIVIEYEMLPYIPRPIERFALKWLGSPYIIEYDDAVYTRYENTKLPILRSKISGLLQDARLVIAGSDYLFEQLRRRQANNLAVIPTSVSSVKFSNIQKQSRNCTLVWIGSNTTAKYVEQISDVLRSILNDNVKLIVIGAGNWRLKDINNVIYKEWNEDEEAQLLSECDIGIMPLPNTDWARGKCGLKIIQYMMAGLPVVASNVGANIEIVTPGTDGYLADGEDDWSQYLGKLINNPLLREQMGIKGRQKALNKYCVENNASKIMHLYIKNMRENDADVHLLRQNLKTGER